MCPFGSLFLNANVGIYDILPVRANATLIHLLEVIRLDQCWASRRTTNGKNATYPKRSSRSLRYDLAGQNMSSERPDRRGPFRRRGISGCAKHAGAPTESLARKSARAMACISGT